MSDILLLLDDAGLGGIAFTGIPSEEAFGVFRVVDMVGVGTPSSNPVGGVPSAEAFGTHNFKHVVNLAGQGIPSAEAFGTPFIGVSIVRYSSQRDMTPATGQTYSKISWEATVPAGTSLTIQTSVDGGTTWIKASNGQEVPGFAALAGVMTGRYLGVRQVFDGTGILLRSLSVQLGEPVQVTAATTQWSYRPPDPVENQPYASATRRTGSATVVGAPPTWFNENTMRFAPWVEVLVVPGRWARFYLGEYINTLPPVSDDGVVVSRSFDLADRTFIYAQRQLTEPYQIIRNRNPILEARHILQDLFGETKFNFPATFATTLEELTFEEGDNWLNVINMLFQATGFEPLITDDDGAWYTRSTVDHYARIAEWTYAPGGVTPSLTEASVDPLEEDIPNVLVFSPARSGPTLPEEGNGLRTIYNQNTGPASIDARNGEHRVRKVTVEAQDQETLDSIAFPMAQRLFAGGGLSLSIKTMINPLHGDSDVIRVVKPRLGLSDATEDWLVTHWAVSVPITFGETSPVMDIVAEKRIPPTFIAMAQSQDYTDSEVFIMDRGQFSVDADTETSSSELFGMFYTGEFRMDESPDNESSSGWSVV